MFFVNTLLSFQTCDHDDSCGLVDETKFLFESKFKLEDSFPDSKTSNESIDAQGSDNIDTKDDLDPFMFCSPRYFVFNEGTYNVMVKDLLGHIKVVIES